MRKSIKIPRILKIEKVEGLKIYVIFNNGETRLLDFERILIDWNVQKSDIEYPLFDMNEFKKVKLHNQTLSWSNLSTKLIDEKGKEKSHPYEIGADVLYKLSQDSECSTQHELSSKINEKRLDSAIDKLKGGSSFQKELID